MPPTKSSPTPISQERLVAVALYILNLVFPLAYLPEIVIAVVPQLSKRLPAFLRYHVREMARIGGTWLSMLLVSYIIADGATHTQDPKLLNLWVSLLVFIALAAFAYSLILNLAGAFMAYKGQESHPSFKDIFRQPKEGERGLPQGVRRAFVVTFMFFAAWNFYTWHKLGRTDKAITDAAFYLLIAGSFLLPAASPWSQASLAQKVGRSLYIIALVAVLVVNLVVVLN